jgi:carbonic anhydrase
VLLYLGCSGGPFAAGHAAPVASVAHARNREDSIGFGLEAGRIGIVAPMFDDLLDANQHYQSSFSLAGLEPRARRGLAVITCMDSRIEPLAMLGLEPGDAKIFRNAGARVTDDVLRSIVLAIHLLGVDRICVVQHTECAMTKYSDDELRTLVGEGAGADASAWEFAAIRDQRDTLRADLARLRACPLVPDKVALGGFVYDVETGALESLDE